MTIDDAIASLARADRLLVALDFDGTLSPLVDDPMSARMAPAARDAVDAIASSPDTTVALVSGRSLSDLRVIAEHGDDSVLLLAGSHGAEHWTPADGTRHPAAGEPTAAERAERDRLRAGGETRFAVVPMTGLGFGGCHFHPSVGDDTKIADAIGKVIDGRKGIWGR